MKERREEKDSDQTSWEVSRRAAGRVFVLHTFYLLLRALPPFPALQCSRQSNSLMFTLLPLLSLLSLSPSLLSTPSLNKDMLVGTSQCSGVPPRLMEVGYCSRSKRKKKEKEKKEMERRRGKESKRRQKKEKKQ